MAGQKFTTYIDSDLLKEIKIQAIRESTTVNKIIDKLLREYLKKQAKAEYPGQAEFLQLQPARLSQC